jgi:PAS domain S-box-containing protein
MQGMPTKIDIQQDEGPTPKDVQLAIAAMESVSEGVFVADAELNVVVGNLAFSRITGYTAEEASQLGAVFITRIARDARTVDRMVGALDELEQFGRWEGDICAVRKSGEPYTAQVSASIIHDQLGAVSHYVVVFSDLSRLH